MLAAEYEPRTEWEAAVCAATRDAAYGDEAEDEIAAEMAAWAEAGLRTATVLESDYPLNLRFVVGPAATALVPGRAARGRHLLGCRGRHAQAERRRPPARAQDGDLLAERGVTVLSGLAAGIDTEAHVAALEAGARTVAVLGHGLGRPVYPKENASLAEEIAERGALVSMFFPETPPTRSTFPMRNVVTSGMGQGSIVVEASKTSGARLQARLAVEHGKPAFFLRSLVAEYEWAREFTAKRGAVIVDNVDDVLPYLRLPDELARVWASEGEAIREVNAGPPAPVARRLAHVRARDQQQLSL